MDLDYIKLGKRIKQIRKDKGLSQNQLSEYADISVNHLSHIECANTKVSLPVLIKIANVLKITVDDILCDSLTAAKTPYINEITRLAQDCNEKEIRLFCLVLKSLKMGYRDLCE